jgi:hypothetical protein
MNERLKALAEIAGIELAYARAEVEMAERIGEEKERIASHLDAVSDALELIASGVEEFEICERLVAARPRATCPALVRNLDEPSGETFWKS